jgi:7-cyano-7-deazaguanine synthase
MGKAIALLSGGLDSGVALLLWRDAGNAALLALFCDYGQRAAVPEQRAAAALAARLQVPFAAVALPWLGELSVASGSALVDRRRDLPLGTVANPGDQQSAAAVWVPARNAVLVSIAAAHAEALGADTVIAGFNREEAATFADNSPPFVAAATAFLGLGTRTGVRVASPTLAMDKRAIGAAAQRLGFVAADFWSCYAGGPSPCGRCESCARSLRAWRQE